MKTKKKLWKFKDWYAKHAEEVSRQRRDRYSSDPDYRTRVLASNRAYRARIARELDRNPDTDGR